MENRETYQGEMETKLQELGAKLDHWNTKKDEITDEAKAEAEEKLRVLKAKKEAVEAKLIELKSSGDEAWETLKSGFQNACDELTSAFEDAIAKFSK
ncbi:MAG: hypothetical protein GW795_06280 [Cyanobacteria bacterium]|nr:hypothetical protein [Cyanobacteria bacterium CG_2015-16_32_12]NCO77654.1 hypothetical protein [Cyanobacteria bacterium CG_2015-22_32_23]NCQ04114.1 hypothetical protein [Cyanobacteria bacterium CG_2015-09_32_10]NCQ41493.1 hypothetical protein [Cyanobacteria bacterium CG_2015-04_32_10]NCS85929.1 hypothetical protein [Cyanobacteria bacterium CG_2015-02_32_10]